MTTEKAIEILSDVGDINRCCAEDAEALDMAIKALKAQPCEDAVSRHKVLDVIERELFKWDVIDEVRKLPSVTPKAKTGQWEYVQYDTPNIGNWHCSRCRGLYYSTDKPRWKYCPSCGARMKESEGER